MATITGTPGTAINAFVTVSNAGQPITQAESSVTAQQTTNDISTLAKRSGLGYTTSVAGPWIVDLAAGGQKMFLGLTTVEKDKSGVHDLDVPHGSVITQIRIYVGPNAHANLPGTPPGFSLWSVNIDGTGTSVLGGGGDSTSPVAAYNAVHEVVFTLSPHITVDRVNKTYYLEFTGESGSDKDDIDILPPRVTLAA